MADKFDPASASGPFSDILMGPLSGANNFPAPQPARTSKGGAVFKLASDFFQGVARGRMQQFVQSENKKLAELHKAHSLFEALQASPLLTGEAKQSMAQKYFASVAGKAHEAIDEGTKGQGGKGKSKQGGMGHGILNVAKEILTGITGGKLEGADVDKEKLNEFYHFGSDAFQKPENLVSTQVDAARKGMQTGIAEALESAKKEGRTPYLQDIMRHPQVAESLAALQKHDPEQYTVAERTLREAYPPKPVDPPAVRTLEYLKDPPAARADPNAPAQGPVAPPAAPPPQTEITEGQRKQIQVGLIKVANKQFMKHRVTGEQGEVFSYQGIPGYWDANGKRVDPAAWERWSAPHAPPSHLQTDKDGRVHRIDDATNKEMGTGKAASEIQPKPPAARGGAAKGAARAATASERTKQDRALSKVLQQALTHMKDGAGMGEQMNNILSTYAKNYAEDPEVGPYFGYVQKNLLAFARAANTKAELQKQMEKSMGVGGQEPPKKSSPASHQTIEELMRKRMGGGEAVDVPTQ